jgi:polyphosphate kinase
MASEAYAFIPAVVEVLPQKPAGPDLSDPALYINRELSWLAFNQRVLAQARDLANPLLERVKFLAIAANNLDEFYMIRMAMLRRHHRAGRDLVSPDGLTVEQQLTIVKARGEAMLADQADCWTRAIRPQLAEAGIHFLEVGDWSAAVRAYLSRVFNTTIGPALTPLAFDPGHPFPYTSNRSKSFAVVVRHFGRTKFARVKVPDVPRFVPVPAEIAGRPGLCFAFLEDVVRPNLRELFPGVEVVGAHLFRIIRDTDIVLEEENAEDLLELVGKRLRQLKHGAPSLLQVEETMPDRVLDILIDNFEIEEDVVVRSGERMGFADWMSVARLNRPALRDPVFTPRPMWQTADAETLFDQIKYQDYLVHHPFESFTSVEAFLTAAVNDPHVVAIKMTLYRIDSNSPLVDLLIDAAERGKQVAVLVELKARFDERSNIGWATRLEEAGVHVVYGLLNLKTHCKLCLVVRQEGERIQRYAHVGTGNYNRVTAQIYTDLGLFTSHEHVVADISELFNYLTGYSNQMEYRQLIVAPVNLRRRFTELVEREAAHARAGRPAHIIVKSNAVSDPGIIRTLYEASQAGVRIDMVVRGICCLRPHVPGVSETIRVRSIVGRFLEHSRIYYFQNDGSEEIYIGSADLMERNLDRRVEALCPVLDENIRRYLRHTVLEAYLRDNARASELRPDGTYVGVEPGEGESFSAQQFLMERGPLVDRDDL